MASLLRISEAASLGLHAMALLAQNSGEEMSNAEVADRLKVSSAHLSKVFQRLSHAGLVEGRRGPRGGFSLAKKPSKITLLDVYEAIEGDFEPDKCLFPEPICSGKRCILGDAIKDINNLVKKALSRTKLSDLKKVFSR